VALGGMMLRILKTEPAVWFFVALAAFVVTLNLYRFIVRWRYPIISSL
jgi:hypothetical protein